MTVVDNGPKLKGKDMLRDIRAQILALMRQGVDREHFREFERAMMAYERRATQKRFQLPPIYGQYDECMYNCVASAWLTPLVMLRANKNETSDPAERGQVHLSQTFRMWVAYKQPLVAVAPELAAALVESTPPDDLLWSDLRWPYHTWCVALPKGFMTTPSGTDLEFLLINRMEASERPVDAPIDPHHQEMIDSKLWEDGRGQNLLEVVLVSSHEVYWRSVRPVASDSISKTVLDFVRTDTNTTKYEDQLVDRAMYFAITLAMYMSANIEDVEQGSQLRTMKPAKELRGLLPKLGPDQVWTPVVVGRQYASELSDAEREAYAHRSPRAHWRRGHWRAQRYGAQLAFIRPTWIKPVLVST